MSSAFLEFVTHADTLNATKSIDWGIKCQSHFLKKHWIFYRSNLACASDYLRTVTINELSGIGIATQYALELMRIHRARNP